MVSPRRRSVRRIVRLCRKGARFTSEPDPIRASSSLLPLIFRVEAFFPSYNPGLAFPQLSKFCFNSSWLLESLLRASRASASRLWPKPLLGHQASSAISRDCLPSRARLQLAQLRACCRSLPLGKYPCHYHPSQF